MSTTLQTEPAGAKLAATWDLDLDEFTVARFAQLVMERGLEHVGAASWPCEKMTLEGQFGRALASLRDRNERAAVLDLNDLAGGDCLAHVSLYRGTVYIRVGARNVDALAAAKSWLREQYPESTPTEEQKVGITFWSMGSHGRLRRMVREIEVPSWPEVSENYPSKVRAKLTGLMGDGFQPGVGGRLILWHGDPGTGKTYALRALAWEWRSWCDVHYITDPETFFGQSPTYMLDVLLDGTDDELQNRWRILILEDTGELLAADAKQQTGQGLSRLLNVVDGLIGQRRRVLVLVTTNELLRSLHPAVSRPGRCAEQIEFVAFTPEEAEEWSARHDRDGGARAGTLASLFAKASGADAPERPKVGFVR